MAAFIRSVLAQVKSEVARVLTPQVIDGVCRDLNYDWRKCTLDPATTVYAFLRQVLEGNAACDHVPHLTGLPVTGEAYCKARSRLPVELFVRLQKKVCDAVATTCDAAALWHGHRLWHMDGSGCSMPDTPELQTAFGQPGGQAPGCGFPVAHLMTLFHATTGCLLRIVTAPLRTHDMSQAQQVHDALRAGDVALGDRAFCSYVHLGLLQNIGVFSVFRMHQKTIVSFRKGRAYAGSPRGRRKKRRARRAETRRAKGRPRSRWVKWLGTSDQIVEYFKPKQRPNWMTAEAFALLPESIPVRELRYRVTLRGSRVREVLLVTTLLDAQRYPATELATLYQQRWEIETNLRHLKQTLRMDVLRTKTVDGIHKELAMYAIVYNLIRLVMLSAADSQNVPVARISFIDAQRRLRHAVAGSPFRKLVVVPDRPLRFEPRVRKRRPKEYDLMKKPRKQLKQDLIRQQLKA
jgi:Transposase DDE domain